MKVCPGWLGPLWCVTLLYCCLLVAAPVAYLLALGFVMKTSRCFVHGTVEAWLRCFWGTCPGGAGAHAFLSPGSTKLLQLA